jgi:hypothetical protein
MLLLSQSAAHEAATAAGGARDAVRRAATLPAGLATQTLAPAEALQQQPTSGLKRPAGDPGEPRAAKVPCSDDTATAFAALAGWPAREAVRRRSTSNALAAMLEALDR